MAGSRLPIAVAHGEGFANFSPPGQRRPGDCRDALRGPHRRATEAYPFNPNGSPGGLTAVTTADGRFTALMPHPERVFRNIQMSWTMTKVAAKKTAGVLGDDLALNAQQVAGVRPTANCRWCGRWPRARCSTRRSWCRRRWPSAPSRPWLITPLLMLGGAFLCFEGFEKLAHKFLHKPGGRRRRPRRS
jgi:hypothetical protein